jgi:parallel beta-helix repeat protein
MSYTLRGRLESRFAAAVPALVVALALHTWWALELVALMLAIGAVLDVAVYHRLLPYQPGWAAVPLGVIELALVYASIRILDVHAPLSLALLLFGIGWLSAQVFGHALFPRLELSYAEHGGELGRVGLTMGAAVAVVLVAGLGAAYATRPPVVHLHGVVRGPLVLRSPQTVVGGVVRGGIVIRSDHVVLRGVTVVGGENGIEVDDAQHVMLDNVHVVGSSLDGIHVRRSAVMIDDCHISSPSGPWVQGIDISFAADKEMSMVEGCTISGVREGIVSHFSQIEIRGNQISDTTLRGITVGEMSMGAVRDNVVSGADGVGIFCVDHSECEIANNTVTRTRMDPSGDLTRAGVAIEAHYFAHATLDDNTIVASPGGVRAFDNSTIRSGR